MPSSFRLPKGTDRRLTELANKTGRTKTFYVNKLFETYFGDLEDAYLAAAEIEAIKDGRSRTHSLEEVKAELGLDN